MSDLKGVALVKTGFIREVSGSNMQKHTIRAIHIGWIICVNR